MTNITHIQFHIGDFLSGVMHMNGAEVGAYTMMLMAHYQAGEKGLVDDDKKLRQICKVNTRAWASIKDTVLDKFYLEDGYWRHSRVIEELQKIHAKAGPGRGKMTNKKPLKETLNDNEKSISETTIGNKSLKNNNSEKTNHKPITNKENNIKEVDNLDAPLPSHSMETEMDFNTWFAEYPNRVGQGGARREYYQALKKVDRDLLLKAVKAYAQVCKDKKPEDRKYIPKPSTWLQEERWADQDVQDFIERPKRPDLDKSNLNHLQTQALETFGEAVYRSWFEPCDVVKTDKGWLIQASSNFIHDWLRNNYLDKLKKLCGGEISLSVSQTAVGE